ncbi:hypothetical protein DSECCO2_429990 [anaerobic digester metagenome]
MDLKVALASYAAAEHLKNSLITVSQLLATVPSYPEGERPGAARMLTNLLGAVRGDAQRAHQATGEVPFQRAAESLSEAISLTESREFEQAAERVGRAVSQATTVAQGAWGQLSKNGLV